MASINDVQFFMKKQKEGGNMNICPRSKGYSKTIGGMVLSGMMIIAAFTLGSQSAMDFFMKDLREKGRNQQQNRR